MKAYRIQARVGGKYMTHILVAENDSEALKAFTKKVSEGKVELKDEDFYYSGHTYVTYEELNESRESTSLEQAEQPQR
jgi:ribosomal protein S21|tara:strand:- start:216 stop:449 length:234 start_codon:yes stop_codon:yes gene_type:complete